MSVRPKGMAGKRSLLAKPKKSTAANSSLKRKTSSGSRATSRPKVKPINIFEILALRNLSEVQKQQLESLSTAPPIRGLGRYELGISVEKNLHKRGDPLLRYQRTVHATIKQGGFCRTHISCQRFLGKQISKAEFRRRRKLAIRLIKEARPKPANAKAGSHGREGDSAKARILDQASLGATISASLARDEVRNELCNRVNSISQIMLQSPVKLVHLLFAHVVQCEHSHVRVRPPFSAFSIDYEDAGILGARKYLCGDLSSSQTYLLRLDRFKWCIAHNRRRSVETARDATIWQESWLGTTGKKSEIDDRTFGDMDLLAWQSVEYPFSKEIPYGGITSEIKKVEEELERARKLNRSDSPNADQKELARRRAAAERLKREKLNNLKENLKALLEAHRWGEVGYYMYLLQCVFGDELIQAAARVCLRYAGLPHLLWDGEPKAFRAATASILGDCSAESLFRMRQFCEECYYSLPPWQRSFVEIDAAESARTFLSKADTEREEYVDPARDEGLWLYADVHPKRQLAPLSKPDSDSEIAEYTDDSKMCFENGEFVLRGPDGERREWPKDDSPQTSLSS